MEQPRASLTPLSPHLTGSGRRRAYTKASGAENVEPTSRQTKAHHTARAQHGLDYLAGKQIMGYPERDKMNIANGGKCKILVKDAVGQLADIATEHSALLGFYDASLPLPEHFSRVLDIGHDIVAFLEQEIPYLGYKITHEKRGKGRAGHNFHHAFAFLMEEYNNENKVGVCVVFEEKKEKNDGSLDAAM